MLPYFSDGYTVEILMQTTPSPYLAENLQNADSTIYPVFPSVLIGRIPAE